jgi:hypothetical protein
MKRYHTPSSLHEYLASVHSMLKLGRTTPAPYSGGSNTENKTLAHRRTQAFVQECARDGNISVILPDQTTEAKTSRHDHMKRMEEEIRAFEQRFNQ